MDCGTSKHCNTMQYGLKMASQKHQSNRWNIAHLLQEASKLHYPAKVVKYAPEGSRGAPGGPAGLPIVPTGIKINVNDPKSCKTYNLKIRGHSALYFICFCNG